ncbi:MAG TPA: sigma-70 family RNA polymerase sigma factor, partial [Flavisolibacter sp.]|nr:sigma-70 family RNA polymerase sigma factor [Flavisolibacter sp.]
EDLAQEIIYQLWKSYNNYKPQYKFSTWMYRVALNVAISFYRKVRAGGHTIHIEEHVFEIEDYSSSAEMEENIKLLEQFIKAFKELDRALILLYLEGKPYKEIAEILGISETNVATRINRIKDKLKQKFATVK